MLKAQDKCIYFATKFHITQLYCDPPTIIKYLNDYKFNENKQKENKSM